MGQTFGGRPAEQFFAKQNTPSLKQLQLTIKPFTGEEIYPGLGSRFFQWGTEFLKEVELAEFASGLQWSEAIKINRLGRCLSGPAEVYFHSRYMQWWGVHPTLFYALDQLNEAFRTTLTRSNNYRSISISIIL